MLCGKSELALVPANASSQLCLVLSFPKGTKCTSCFPWVWSFCSTSKIWRRLEVAFHLYSWHTAALASRDVSSWAGREYCQSVQSPSFSPCLCLASWREICPPLTRKDYLPHASQLPTASHPGQAGDNVFCFRVRKRHCSELWRCPWQSQHAAQYSHPGTAPKHVVWCALTLCVKSA